MAGWNSIQRGNIIALRHAGYDPTGIIDEGLILPTAADRHAIRGKIPMGTPDTESALGERDPGTMSSRDANVLGQSGTRGGGSDPYPGMGKF